MTEADFAQRQAQVAALQQELDDRRKNWRTLSRASTWLAVLLAGLSIGFALVAAWIDPRAFPSTHQYASAMGTQFLFGALPLALLSQALRMRWT